METHLVLMLEHIWALYMYHLVVLMIASLIDYFLKVHVDLLMEK